MAQPAPQKALVGYPERPLTPPTTPDRPSAEQTVLSPSSSASETQNGESQATKMFDFGLSTPQSMPRRTGKSDQRTPPETPLQRHHDQRQATLRPRRALFSSPAETQARQLEYATQRERTDRKIREAELASLVADDVLNATGERLEEIEGMTFEEMMASYKPGRQQEVKKVKVKVQALDSKARARATTVTHVSPPNFGHRPGEAWLARREWEAFLRRRESVWGCSEGEGS